MGVRSLGLMRRARDLALRVRWAYAGQRVPKNISRGGISEDGKEGA